MSAAENVKTEKVEKAKKVSGACPWCSYDNKDASAGPLHDACDSKLVKTYNGKDQCVVCGKIWSAEKLGKPWSIAQERGHRWEREAKARTLNGF